MIFVDLQLIGLDKEKRKVTITKGKDNKITLLGGINHCEELLIDNDFINALIKLKEA